MKTLLTLTFCALWLLAPAQTPTKTEILDSYSDKIRPLFGSKAAMLKMSAVRTSDSLSKKMAVIIEVVTETSEAVATSTSVAFGNGGGWAVGGAQVRELKKEAGRRVLDAAELGRFISLFNNLIQTTGNEKPETETLWRHDIDEGFSIALSYRPGRIAPYSYILAMDGAVYEVDAANSLSMLKKLAAFRNLMK